MESIKINKLEIENVKRIKAVKIEPTANGLTIVGGNNNQGKTSVLDSIAWALGGDKFRPSQAQREGSMIPPTLHLVLSNGLVVERKGKNSSLKVTDPSGQKGGQQLLNEFVEQLALDLPKFMISIHVPAWGTTAYVNGQWLPWVTNYNNVSSDGYAGIPRKAVTGLKAYTVGSQSAVGNLQYRVHLRGGQWLSWVTDASGKAPNDYAGIYGHVIDGIQVRLINKPGYHAEVRVQLTDRTGWLDWSSQYSTGANSYAGIYGVGIDRIQIRIVKN